MGDLKDHLTKCGSSPVTCPNKCKVDDLQLLRKSLKDHLETKCPNRAYSCEHCGLRGKYARIVGEHDEECERKSIPCLNTQCRMPIECGQMEEHIQTVCEFTVVPCKYNSIGCKLRRRRMWMKQHEKGGDKAHFRTSLKMISKLNRKFALSLKKTHKLHRTLSYMKMNSSTFGCITYKMSDYEMSRENNLKIFSKSFYSSPSGYKMCIRIHPNGHGEAQGSHVSVFIKLLDGLNGDSLDGPFRGTVKFELLNQLADNSHHAKTLTSATDNDMLSDISCYGCSKFLHHSGLSHDSARNTQYLMDDTLYFRATVTVKDPKPWLVCTHPST